jgi:hypothetical protein
LLPGCRRGNASQQHSNIQWYTSQQQPQKYRQRGNHDGGDRDSDNLSDRMLQAIKGQSAAQQKSDHQQSHAGNQFKPAGHHSRRKIAK